MASSSRRGTWIAVCLLFAAAGRGWAATIAPDGGARAALEGDSRLTARRSLTLRDRPLEEALRSLSGGLKLRLTATREMADEKATLLLAERPVGELLATLAEQFDGVWRRTGDGYRLERTAVESRRTAEAPLATLRATDLWMERLAALCQLPTERLQARQQEVERELARPDLPTARRSELREEADLLRDRFRHDRVIPIIVAVYRSLTSAERRQLATLGHVRITNQSNLLAKAAGRRLARALQEPGEELQPPLLADFTFRLSDAVDDGERLTGSRRLRLETLATLVTGRDGQASGATSVNWCPQVPGPVPVPKLTPTVTDDPALKRQVRLKLTVSSPVPLAPEQGVVTEVLARWPPEYPTLGTVLEALHRETGLEFVADSFIQARLSPAQFRSPLAVFEALDAAARELDFAWRKDGNRVLLASLHRPDDRAMEVAERVLAWFRPRLAAPNAPTLDDLADLASALTDRQCRSVEDYWRWYFPEARALPPWRREGFFSARDALRLWQTLTPLQRLTVRSVGISNETLTPLQWALWARAFSDAPASLWSPDELVSLPPIQAMPATPLSGSFALSSTASVAQAFRAPNGTVTTSITGAVDSGPFIDVQRNAEGQEVVSTREGPPVPLRGFTFLFTLEAPVGENLHVRALLLYLLPH